jgi:DNA-binding transcriptional regulator YiaG
MPTYTANQLVTAGYTTWAKPGSDETRVYINDWAKMAGLLSDRYKTGNIREATLNGQHISNTRAGRVLAAKVYWCSTDSVMHISNFQGAYEIIGKEELWAGIHAGIAAKIEKSEQSKPTNPTSDDHTDPPTTRSGFAPETQGAFAAGEHTEDIRRKVFAGTATLEELAAAIAAEQKAWDDRRAVRARKASEQEAPVTPEPAAIIAALRAAGRTARQIAAAVGVHVSTIYRWARGAFRPTTARLTLLAAVTA